MMKECWLILLEQVEVFYLPSDSLELNPDENLNCDPMYGTKHGLPPGTPLAVS